MPQTNGPSREQMREELRQLTPVERQARIRELREKFGPAPGEDLERRREELKNLSPEQRRAKILDWRARRPGGASANSMSPAQWEQQRKVLRERIEKQIAELQKQNSNGALHPQARRRMEQLQQVAKYFDQSKQKSSTTLER